MRRNKNENNKTYSKSKDSFLKAQIPKNMTPFQNTNANNQPQTGFLAVGVFTALGALPVKDSEITVYKLNSIGEERVFYRGLTDENGRVPDIELNVVYDPSNPAMSQEFYFDTYNLRVEAANYYIQTINNFRVFPGIKTNLRINLVPLIQNYKWETPYHKNTRVDIAN